MMTAHARLLVRLVQRTIQQPPFAKGGYAIAALVARGLLEAL